MMETLLDIQRLQLRLIESASVTENCALDLLRELPSIEVHTIISIIGLLQNEADVLRKLSKAVTGERYPNL